MPFWIDSTATESVIQDCVWDVVWTYLYIACIWDRGTSISAHYLLCGDNWVFKPFWHLLLHSRKMQDLENSSASSAFAGSFLLLFFAHLCIIVFVIFAILRVLILPWKWKEDAAKCDEETLASLYGSIILLATDANVVVPKDVPFVRLDQWSIYWPCQWNSLILCSARQIVSPHGCFVLWLL